MGEATGTDGGGTAPASPGLLQAAALRVTGNVAAAAATLGTSVLLARGLGPDDRGALAAIAAPVLLAATLVQVSSGNVLSAEVASRRRTVAQAALPALVVSSALAAALALLLLACSELLVDDPAHRPYFYLLLSSMVLHSFTVTVRSVRMGEHRHRALSVEVVATAVLTALLVLLLVATDRLTVSTAAAVLALTYLVPALLLGPRLPLRARQLWAETRQFGRDALRALPGTAAAQLNMRIDQPVLAAVAVDRQLGIYVVAVVLAETPRIALAALRQVFLTDAAARTDHEKVARLTRVVTLALLPGIVLGALLADDVVHVLYGEAFSAAAPVVAVLLLGTLLAVPGMFLGTAMFAAGRQGRAGLPELAGLCVTVPMLVILVPSHGALGAAVASVLSYATTTGTAFVLFRQYSGLSSGAVLLPQRQDLRSLREAVDRLRPRRR